jgi:hypothetical protein
MKTMTVFLMRHGERLDEANRRQKTTGEGASREDKLGELSVCSCCSKVTVLRTLVSSHTHVIACRSRPLDLVCDLFEQTRRSPYEGTSKRPTRGGRCSARCSRDKAAMMMMSTRR